MAHDSVDDLLHFIDASPTPYHAVQEVRRRLEAVGYRALAEGEPWDLEAGTRFYTVRGDASIAAFQVGREPPAVAGFRLIGAHTDSPNLRLKPNPTTREGGCVKLGVETYGGVLWYTWLDRDLSLAGRVLVARGDEVAPHVIDFARPLLRIPSLAIHLDRGVNKDGLRLDPQRHLPPLIALSGEAELDVRAVLADELGRAGVEARPDEVLGWDLCCYDLQPATRSGLSGEFVHAARLDNLGSCHAAIAALMAAPADAPASLGVVLYDHEEVGSRSAQGAASSFLRTCLERVATARSAAASDALPRAVARSFMISADMAHAVHPNFADRHDPQHQPVLGKGPTVKINANQAYATDGAAWAAFERWSREAEVTAQRFVVRSDLPCGSTIGPITAAELGLRVVDVGNPMLSMHSCREMAAAADVPKMIAVMERFLGSSP